LLTEKRIWYDEVKGENEKGGGDGTNLWEKGKGKWGGEYKRKNNIFLHAGYK